MARVLTWECAQYLTCIYVMDRQVCVVQFILWNSADMCYHIIITPCRVHGQSPRDWGSPGDPPAVAGRTHVLSRQFCAYCSAKWMHCLASGAPLPLCVPKHFADKARFTVLYYGYGERYDMYIHIMDVHYVVWIYVCIFLLYPSFLPTHMGEQLNSFFAVACIDTQMCYSCLSCNLCGCAISDVQQAHSACCTPHTHTCVLTIVAWCT